MKRSTFLYLIVLLILLLLALAGTNIMGGPGL
jgi:hypothetical protein